MTPNDLAKLLRPVKRRLNAAITRGYVLAVNATGTRVRLKAGLRDGEIGEDLDYLEPYGFTGIPLPDGDGVLTLAVGGHGNNRVALAAGGRAHRPRDLQPGEVCLYTHEGDEIRFQRGRKIRVIGGSQVYVQTAVALVEASESATIQSPQITLDAPMVRCTGDVQIGGAIHSDGNASSDGQVSDANGSMQEMRGVYNGHNHTGDDGGSTSSPRQEMT